MTLNRFVSTFLFFSIMFPFTTTWAQSDADLIAKFEKRTYTYSSLTMPYRLFVPEDYNSSTAYPLVLTLHGSGECGNDNEMQLTANRMALCWADSTVQDRWPGFVVAPQCPSGNSWTNYEVIMTVMDMIDSLKNEFNIDPDRLYITGLSMGGYGSFYMTLYFPYKFAASIPVCGGGDRDRAVRIAHIPTWIFHGNNDNMVNVSNSRLMVSAFEMLGRNCIYTNCNFHTDSCTPLPDSLVEQYIAEGDDFFYSELDGVGHNVWDNAYSYAPLFAWTFSQRRSSAWQRIEELVEAGVTLDFSTDTLLTDQPHEFSADLYMSSDINTSLDNIVLDQRNIEGDFTSLQYIKDGQYQITTTLETSKNGYFRLPAMIEPSDEPGKFYWLADNFITVIPGTDYQIYDDDFADNWSLQFNEAYSDTAAVEFVKSKTFSHKIAIQQGGYVRYIPGNDDNISLFGYSYLQFYINGGNAFEQNFSVRVKSVMPPLNSVLFNEMVIAPQADSWTQVIVPIFEHTSLTSIEFFTTAATDTFYIDDMRLISKQSQLTSIPEEKHSGSATPTEFDLSQNYPNPFNPTTNISYSVSQPGEVLIIVYDILGKRVATLVNEEKTTGSYSVDFNGVGLSSGIYFYQMRVNDFVETKKMILLR